MSEKFSPKLERIFKSEKDHIEITDAERREHNLLLVGPYTREDMKFGTVSTPELSEGELAAREFVQQYAAAFLDKVNAERQKTGAKLLTDGPLVHITGIKEGKGKSEVEFARDMTSYAKQLAFKGDNIKAAYAEYEQTTPQAISFERFKELFYPLSPTVAGTVITADNYCLLTKRHPEKTGLYGNAWHLPSGYVDRKDVDENGSINPFLAMQRELKEETGVSPELLDSLVCMGLAKSPTNPYADFIFVGRTHLRHDQIIDESAPTTRERFLLNPDPKELDGDVRPKKLVTETDELTELPAALMKLDQYWEGRTKGKPNPELTVPTSRALFFLLERMLGKK